MQTCGQTLCFQLQCQCSEERIPQQVPKNTISNQFYQRAAATLQMELKKQRDSYAREIDGLNNQLFQLKNTILRMEMRNEKTIQVERELRRQYNIVLQKLKENEPRVVNRVEIIQKIKQVRVEVQNKELERQIAAWKNKNSELNIQFQKNRLQKEFLASQNDNLKAQVQKLNRLNINLKEKYENAAKTVEQKDSQIQKLNLQIEYLKNNKQVVVQTKHLFPDFRQEQKVRTQTKIETVYAEKPIEKLVFVDIVKRVKQFIQPQKAVVNRIISCQEKAQCDCDQNQSRIEFYRNQANHFSSLVESLESNITSYKAERQNLVKIIGDKNSELNYLQTKVKLFGEVGKTKYSKGGSTVNVQVNRVKQQKAGARNVSSTQQKATNKK